MRFIGFWFVPRLRLWPSLTPCCSCGPAVPHSARVIIHFFLSYSCLWQLGSWELLIYLECNALFFQPHLLAQRISWALLTQQTPPDIPTHLWNTDWCQTNQFAQRIDLGVSWFSTRMPTRECYCGESHQFETGLKWMPKVWWFAGLHFFILKEPAGKHCLSALLPQSLCLPVCCLWSLNCLLTYRDIAKSRLKQTASVAPFDLVISCC